MIIETLLTNLGRKNTDRYLTFDRSGDLSLPDQDADRSYLVYLHIPFCETLCPYCSFNRIPFEPVLAEEYFNALQVEMEMYHSRGYSFEAVYIGGGTPTILPDRITQVIEKARSLWPVQSVSIETNPNHLTDPIVELLNQAGVNRLSVGVQTFDDDLLTSLGRLNKYGSGDEIKQRLNTYRGVFDTLNIDMIYNFPTQTSKQLAEDLESIKDLNIDQVTYYPLMASKMKHDDIVKELGRMDYRKEKVFYRMIREELADTYEPASAWCYSRKQGMIDEYIVDYPEYAGLGSGAFGFLGGSIYANTFSVNSYIRSVRESRLPLAGVRRFSPREKALYSLLMDLFGGTIHFSNEEKALIWKEFIGLRLSGAVRKGDGGWITTDRGRYYAVILMREFFNGVNNLREARLRADK